MTHNRLPDKQLRATSSHEHLSLPEVCWGEESTETSSLCTLDTHLHPNEQLRIGGSDSGIHLTKYREKKPQVIRMKSLEVPNRLLHGTSPFGSSDSSLNQNNGSSPFESSALSDVEWKLGAVHILDQTMGIARTNHISGCEDCEDVTVEVGSPPRSSNTPSLRSSQAASTSDSLLAGDPENEMKTDEPLILYVPSLPEAANNL